MEEMRNPFGNLPAAGAALCVVSPRDPVEGCDHFNYE
ncbi:MAG: hypothetical protein JWL77_1803 [Chthonomonadaceae bacterium]|nr:hypothetical protein [Chthonomonadaceae bacterium]